MGEEEKYYKVEMKVFINRHGKPFDNFDLEFSVNNLETFIDYASFLSSKYLKARKSSSNEDLKNYKATFTVKKITELY